jgi:hypothetical protein
MRFLVYSYLACGAAFVAYWAYKQAPNGSGATGALGQVTSNPGNAFVQATSWPVQLFRLAGTKSALASDVASLFSDSSTPSAETGGESLAA